MVETAQRGDSGNHPIQAEKLTVEEEGKRRREARKRAQAATGSQGTGEAQHRDSSKELLRMKYEMCLVLMPFPAIA